MPILVEVPPPSDLQVVNIEVPTSGLVGSTITITWTVENRGTEAATGFWDDAVYLSSDNIWDLGDSLLGRREGRQLRTLAPGEAYTVGLEVKVPPRLPGDYRILVRTDIFDDIFEAENNRNNTGFSANSLRIDVAQLVVGNSLTDSLATGGWRLYRLDTRAGQTIEIDLQSLDGAGAHELYVRHEGLPSPIQYDHAFAGGLKANQSVVIPETLAGTYYVLARAGIRANEVDEQGNPLPPPAARGIRVSAKRLPFGITHVSPDRAGQSRYVTVEIEGAEFPANATVRLIRPTISEHAPVSIQRVDATKIIAVFDLRTAAMGLYDVVVLHPDGRQAIEPYRFQIEAVDPMRVDVGVGGPSLIAIGGTGVYGVTVRNLANIDTPYTEVTVAVPRIQNPMPSLIPGEALKVFSGVNGLPDRSNLDLSQYDALMNLGGVYTTGGVLLDLPTHKFESSSIFVQTYPELVRLLEEDPLFLKRLDPAQIDLLSFEFYVAAAATPLTAAEYLDRKRQEAAKIRTAILADSNAPTALAQLANDANSWTSAYLLALGAVGLIRPEDTPPVADGRAQVVANFFGAVAGLLGTDAGTAVLRNIDRDPVNATAAKTALVERIRGYLGTPRKPTQLDCPIDLSTTSERPAKLLSPRFGCMWVIHPEPERPVPATSTFD